jgi:hypothetical protein
MRRIGPMKKSAGFIPPHGNYRQLLFYRKARRLCLISPIAFVSDFLAKSVDSESNPDLALLNKDTVVARALLGAAVGQERDFALPMGKRTIRILEILKPSSENFGSS